MNVCRPPAKIPLAERRGTPRSRDRLARNGGDVILTLARLSTIDVSESIPERAHAQFVVGEAVAALPLGDVIDFAKERVRLEKELNKAHEEIARFDAKLSK